MNKVNALIKDGLKVSGLVVVGFRSHNDKRKVMEKKSVLRDSQQYECVYINHDKSLQERQMADNFRSILNSLNVGDLVMKGSRVMKGNKRDRVSSPTDVLRDNNRSSGDGNVSNNDRLERNSQSDRQGGNPNIDRRGLNYSNDRWAGIVIMMGRRTADIVTGWVGIMAVICRKIVIVLCMKTTDIVTG
ncbi:hypothetical protein DPMN_075784 [Dreissena polymorpha]|uniref:Uncharacterized protein n=1 Tax=Dreissena polymorpha TaxID=45954 RepID=A0A9D4BLT8_DREPO|nr:hypothetical protein DPMN_075784 [Dreissena polymorpha]